MQLEVNHFTAVALDEQGKKVKGFDYRSWADAEQMRQRLQDGGAHRTEVWARNCYGERLCVDGKGGLREEVLSC